MLISSRVPVTRVGGDGMEGEVEGAGDVVEGLGGSDGGIESR